MKIYMLMVLISAIAALSHLNSEGRSRPSNRPDGASRPRTMPRWRRSRPPAAGSGRMRRGKSLDSRQRQLRTRAAPLRLRRSDGPPRSLRTRPGSTASGARLALVARTSTRIAGCPGLGWTGSTVTRTETRSQRAQHIGEAVGPPDQRHRAARSQEPRRGLDPAGERLARDRHGRGGAGGRATLAGAPDR